MLRLGRYILVLALPAALLAEAALADGEGLAGAMNAPPYGSRAGQLALKFRLEAVARLPRGGTLASAIGHNQHEWMMLSPDQREQFRRDALAFLRKNPTEQEKLMQQYSAYLALSKQKRLDFQRRAEWLKVVVATFTPDERQQLEKMLPIDRAKALIARRDELVRQGKLKLPPPTTAPADKQ